MSRSEFGRKKEGLLHYISDRHQACMMYRKVLSKETVLRITMKGCVKGRKQSVEDRVFVSK